MFAVLKPESLQMEHQLLRRFPRQTANPSLPLTFGPTRAYGRAYNSDVSC